MRRLALLLFLLPALAFAEEEPAADPVAGLPGCLRPGAHAVLIQEAAEGRLKGTLEYRVEAGTEKGTVLVRTSFATADLGPLTFRYRLTAVLDAATRSFVLFTYEIGGSDPEKFLMRARLRRDPERPTSFIHERFTHRRGAAPRITKSRPKLPKSFALDLLEPFCTALLKSSEGAPTSLTLVTVERGRVLSKPAKYQFLGEGEMEISGVEVPCRILTRTRGDDRSTVYLRKSDQMPLSHGVTRLKDQQ